MNKPADEFRFRDVVDLVFGPDYVLTVKFDDGAERTIDFEPILLGSLFGPLRDLHLFRQAGVDADLGTIVWPNGTDIAPDVLYDWPQHVDAIVQRRRQRFALEAPVHMRPSVKRERLDWLYLTSSSLLEGQHRNQVVQHDRDKSGRWRVIRASV